MRIVSLLPSLTELVCALGRGDELVGVTHECDFPSGVELLPHLTRSRIAASASSLEIDSAVSAQGGSLYELDEKTLAELRPDLILTQEQCDVCAVNEKTVRRAAEFLPGNPPVESVNPTDLAGVHAVFRRIGELLDASAAAEGLIASYFSTVNFIQERIRSREPRTTVLLEWFDPPFSSGHWNPEIVEHAGGRELLAKAGERSRRITWEDLLAADPEYLLLSPCGFTIERTETELLALAARPEWQALRAVKAGNVTIIDGSAYFSRPGPRLEMSLKIAALAIHPDLFPEMIRSDFV